MVNDASGSRDLVRAGAPLAPAGVALPELLLVAWLFAFVLAAVAGFAARQGRSLAGVRDAVRAEDVRRVAGLVLGSELRALAPADIIAFPGDSVRIRAVRGVGPLCARDGDRLVVRYRGIRLPDPAKDSALIVTGASELHETVVPVIGWTPSDVCPDGLAIQLGRTSDGSDGSGSSQPRLLPEWGLLLIFETGSYSFGRRAFRYRRGQGGRQPLTEELLADGEIEARADRILLRLLYHPGALPHLTRDTAVTLSLGLRNGGAP